LERRGKGFGKIKEQVKRTLEERGFEGLFFIFFFIIQNSPHFGG